MHLLSRLNQMILQEMKNHPLTPYLGHVQKQSEMDMDRIIEALIMSMTITMIEIMTE
jgi:hypothetical protein